MQTNKSRDYSLIGLLDSGPLFAVSSPWCQVSDNQWQLLYPGACWNHLNKPTQFHVGLYLLLFFLNLLRLLTTSCSFPPLKIMVKSLAHLFPITPSGSWLTPVLPHVALPGMACPVLLGTVSNTLCFQCSQLHSLLLALPHTDNNKTYILKH